MNSDYIKVNCKYCGHTSTSAAIKKHEKSCYLNPENLKLCPICSKPIKNYKENKTCSYSCSNTYFRSGEENGNWKSECYISTCFLYHKKECIICGEDKIVAVHHLDENKNNNSPENLIPLCPTHHHYWHSRFKHLIEKKVYEYIAKLGYLGSQVTPPHLGCGELVSSNLTYPTKL